MTEIMPDAASLTWPTVLSSLVEGRHLSLGEARWAMGRIMSGEATPAQTAGLLMAQELRASQKVLGGLAAPLDG